MNNLMAKDMTRRYAEYLHTGNLEERGGKIIYFWVMSTLESFFWGLWLTASFKADLYASGFLTRMMIQPIMVNMPKL